ncbi:hypothetical protein AHAS_Ahas15G0106400 [Arachis hypogaea]
MHYRRTFKTLRLEWTNAEYSTFFWDGDGDGDDDDFDMEMHLFQTHISARNSKAVVDSHLTMLLYCW